MFGTGSPELRDNLQLWSVLWVQTFRVVMNDNPTGKLPLWQGDNICVTTFARHIVLSIFMYSTISCACVFSKCRDYFPAVKRPERKDNNSPPSSAVAKNTWSYTSTLRICFRGVNMANPNFTLYCVLIYMYLYFHRVYKVNVTCTVRRIIFLITLPTITCVFITFLDLYKS